MLENHKYEAVIGLEVHAQLLTKSKMFCRCPSDYLKAAPNTVVCPVCLAMPGVLPVINRQAVEYVIMTGLALNSKIAETTQFHRKNYPYPDLMKGYQISQYDIPIALGGSLSVDIDGKQKTIGITRVHLEEDVAKLHHYKVNNGENYSLIDVNRSGIALMETVSEPDMHSADEARKYLTELRSILQYLGVSTGNMEDGSFRCDANISIRPTNSKVLNTKVEIKNLNSIHSVYQALEFEKNRQIMLTEDGDTIVQETRGWDEEKEITFTQRTKENANDYRYIPEPDLPPIQISKDWIEQINLRLPELPTQKRNRLAKQYGLTTYDAALLTTSKGTADFFEESLKGTQQQSKDASTKAKASANWLLGDLAALLKESAIELDASYITPHNFGAFIEMIESGTINGPAAKTIFGEMFNSGKEPNAIAKDHNLTQINNVDLLDAAIEKVLQNNPPAIKDFAAGKASASQFLVGQVMKETRGRANPSLVNKILLDKLNSGDY